MEGAVVEDIDPAGPPAVARASVQERQSESESDVHSDATGESESDVDSDATGEVRMKWQTAGHFGGRKISIHDGGTLYEVSSRNQQMWCSNLAESFWEPLSPGQYQVKTSIEATRTRIAQATKNFLCEGTMFRHTEKSWAEAPCEFQEPHVVKASKSNPVKILLRECQFEELLPFDCDVYWATAWRKCQKCKESDKMFKDWVAAAPCKAKKSQASAKWIQCLVLGCAFALELIRRLILQRMP